MRLLKANGLAAKASSWLRMFYGQDKRDALRDNDLLS
jgi:hypothetical protein